MQGIRAGGEVTATLLPPPPGWTKKAACNGKYTSRLDPWHPPEDMASGERKRVLAWARSFCLSCPVQPDCLRYALELIEDEGSVEGMYGGMEPGEIRALARRLTRPARKIPRHGTRSRYVAGCACEPCKASNAAYERQRRLQAA